LVQSTLARWGHSFPPRKRGQSPPPIFSPSFLWPNGWMHQDATWYGVCLSTGNFVLDGDPAPTPKGAEPHPIFGPRLLWPNGCMDQDATWYGGRPRPTRHCVQGGPSYPQKKGTLTPPNFWPMSIMAKCWMDEDAAGYGSRPRPKPHCTRRGPSSRERGTAAPHSFRSMSIVATVAHLSYC